MKKPTPRLGIFFFSVDGSASKNGVVALGGRKTWEILRFFHRRTRVQEVQERTAGAPGTAMLRRAVESLSTGSTPLQSWKNMEYLEKKPEKLQFNLLFTTIHSTS